MVNRGEEGGETVHGCWLLHPTPPLNPAVAPFGRGLTVRVTGCVGPFTRPTLIVLLPDPPGEPIEISPVFDKEKSKPATPTFKENVVECLEAIGMPVTVMGNVPVGVDGIVEIVSAGDAGGDTMQLVWLIQPLTPALNNPLAPGGKPLALRVTLCVVPQSPTFIVLEPDPPGEPTDMSPEFDKT